VPKNAVALLSDRFGEAPPWRNGRPDRQQWAEFDRRAVTFAPGGELSFAAGGVNVCSELMALIHFGAIVQDN